MHGLWVLGHWHRGTNRQRARVSRFFPSHSFAVALLLLVLDSPFILPPSLPALFFSVCFVSLRNDLFDLCEFLKKLSGVLFSTFCAIFLGFQIAVAFVDFLFLSLSLSVFPPFCTTLSRYIYAFVVVVVLHVAAAAVLWCSLLSPCDGIGGFRLCFFLSHWGLFDGFMSAMWGGVCLIWLKSAVSFHALLVFSQFLSVVFPLLLLLRICSSIGDTQREDKHAFQRVVREFVGSVS